MYACISIWEHVCHMCVVCVWCVCDSLRYALGVMLSMRVCFWYTLKYVRMLYMRTCVWYMCDMCVIRVWCVCEMCVTVCYMFFGMWSRHVCLGIMLSMYVCSMCMTRTCVRHVYIVGKEWQDSLLCVLSIMLSMHVCSWDNVKYVCMLYMRTCVWYVCDVCVICVWHPHIQPHTWICRATHMFHIQTQTFT